MNCPYCNKPISDLDIAHYLSAKGGSVKSERKTESCRNNGKKGGRPRIKKVSEIKPVEEL